MRTVVTASIAIATVAIHYEGRDTPKLIVKRLSAHLDGKQLASHEATALKISGRGWEDEICLYHGNVRPGA